MAALPFERSARLVGLVTRRGVATASEKTPAQEAPRQLQGQGFGPVLVLNPAGVLMGAVGRDKLESAPAETEAGALMRFGVSTVRPSEQVANLVHRMGHAEVSRIVVIRSDGTLPGLFFADDLTQARPLHSHGATPRAVAGADMNLPPPDRPLPAPGAPHGQQQGLRVLHRASMPNESSAAGRWP